MHWTAHYIDCYIFKIHLLITKTCQMSLWCAKEGKKCIQTIEKAKKEQKNNRQQISPLNDVRSIWTENNTLFHSVYMVILGECASACLFFFLVVSRLRFFSKALFPNPLKCTTLKFTHRFSRCHANSVLIKWGKFEKCSEKVAFGSQWLKMFVLNSWRIDHITNFVRLTQSNGIWLPNICCVPKYFAHASFTLLKSHDFIPNNFHFRDFYSYLLIHKAFVWQLVKY